MAHFLLGRVYWRDRSVVKAKREFDLAWQIDPERFERSYARLKSQQEGVPELFAYTGGREDEVSVSSQYRVRRRYGDFRTAQEARRFESMPPITRDEIASIDWGRFEDEFDRDQQSR